MKTRLKQQTNAASSQASVKLHAQLRSCVSTCLVSLIAVLALGVSSASAATAGPGFTISSFAAPTHFSAAENTECEAHFEVYAYCDSYQVFVTNAGSEPTDGGVGGSPIVLTDTLPEGVTVRGLELQGLAPALLYTPLAPGVADAEGGGAKAVTDEHCGVSGRVVRCTWENALEPDALLKLIVYVTVDEPEIPGLSLTNRAEVSGGGAAGVSTEPVTAGNEVNSVAAPFGTSNFDFFISGPDGVRDAQAGDHPYELSVTFDMNSAFHVEEVTGAPLQRVHNVGTVKDIVVDLPLGFLGSTLAAAECTLAQLSTEKSCPPDTIVGHLLTEPDTATGGINGPIYDMVPERGHPAEFGYVDALKGAHVFYTQVVPTPQGYVLQTSANEIPESNLRRITVTFYGDPAEKQAELEQHEQEAQTGHPVERERPAVQVPFFTNPTLCAGANQVATLYMDSWQSPGAFNPNGTPDVGGPGSNWVEAKSVSPPVQGCNQVGFTPELKAQPTTNAADTPSGLEFEVKLAQSEAFGTLATPPLQNLSVTFPQGMTVDPSSADGLGTCSEAQIGWLGPDGPNGEALPNHGLTNFSPEKPECPSESKIGSLELESPLIPGKIYGEVYLASQDANPFGTTFALYVVVNDPVTGVVIKIAGELKAGGAGLALGQLTSVFDQNPQLPFSILQVHFFGGPRAELATPPSCGIYQTNSELQPWSFPDSGLPATPFDSYEIDENCAIGFNPGFVGLTSNVQAGQYTPFLGSFEREDDDQELAGLTMHLPPGLLADVASVPLCGEAQVAAEVAGAGGGCPESTQVGTVTAEAGPGPNPLAVPGKVFLTGPYNGGPYGLAVVVAANPGPFHFGNVVVRQSLRIDPITAAVTDVSDTFPTYLDPRTTNSITHVEETTGIPIKLRRVDFDIDRSGFTFNPTSCDKLQVGGAITSTAGQSKTLQAPFQATNCGVLKFAPKFAVSTSGRTSKALGASLTAKVTYPSASQGTYANIAKVKVELPKALPSRLTTLQKACTDAQFNLNPANCPAASKIGFAVVHTPILPGTLSGPAIFVSHGGEAFPSLTMVLQGDGVTIDLVGTTFISKSGITSTTFKTVPDAPVGSFELTLPEGKYSALAANGNLCTQKLTMPNEFIAQNGAAIHETTDIGVTGCAKSLSRSAKLSKALKACHKKHGAKRTTCEAQAHKAYGPVKKSKKGKK